MFGKKSSFGFGFNLGPLSLSLGSAAKKSWAEFHAFFDRVLTSGAGKKTTSSQMKEYRSWVYIASSVIYRRVGTVPFKFYLMTRMRRSRRIILSIRPLVRSL